MIAEPSSGVYIHTSSSSSASGDALTSDSLSKYILDFRHGKVAEAEDETKLMLDLVEEYSTFEDIVRKKDFKNGLDCWERSTREGQVVVSATYQCLFLRVSSNST